MRNVFRRGREVVELYERTDEGEDGRTVFRWIRPLREDSARARLRQQSGYVHCSG
jgi:hypothetical protein